MKKADAFASIIRGDDEATPAANQAGEEEAEEEETPAR